MATKNNKGAEGETEAPKAFNEVESAKSVIESLKGFGSSDALKEKSLFSATKSLRKVNADTGCDKGQSLSVARLALASEMGMQNKEGRPASGLIKPVDKGRVVMVPTRYGPKSMATLNSTASRINSAARSSEENWLVAEKALDSDKPPGFEDFVSLATSGKSLKQKADARSKKNAGTTPPEKVDTTTAKGCEQALNKLATSFEASLDDQKIAITAFYQGFTKGFDAAKAATEKAAGK